MNVGDYVRTEKDEIGKITYINSSKTAITTDYQTNKNIRKNLSIKEIIKSSPNIIDLIEVGDYVNDEKIVGIGLLTNGPEKGTKTIDYYIAPNTLYYFKNEDIKSIVTKEMYFSVEYRVEDN